MKISLREFRQIIAEEYAAVKAERLQEGAFKLTPSSLNRIIMEEIQNVKAERLNESRYNCNRPNVVKLDNMDLRRIIMQEARKI